MKKERPILFSTPMVQALLAGRKTHTRRIVKDAIGWDKNWKVSMIDEEHRDGDPRYEMRHGFQYSTKTFKCPYGQPGDILWVRENVFKEGRYCTEQDQSGEYDTFWRGSGKLTYAATDPRPIPSKIVPSIHMPKAVSRIWLEITDIRVERVQEISEADAISEGILFYDSPVLGRRYKDYLADASGYGHPEHDYPTTGSAITSYGTLWAKINGIESWKANPWVWAVSSKILSTTGKPDNK